MRTGRRDRGEARKRLNEAVTPPIPIKARHIIPGPGAWSIVRENGRRLSENDAATKTWSKARDSDFTRLALDGGFLSEHPGLEGRRPLVTVGFDPHPHLALVQGQH